MTKQSLPWLIAVTAIAGVALATSGGGLRSTEERSVHLAAEAESLGLLADDTSEGADSIQDLRPPLEAVVVIRDQDCDGLLQALPMFQRASFAQSVRLRGILVNGTDAGVARLKGRLADAQYKVEVRTLPARSKQALDDLAGLRTPYVVVAKRRTRGVMVAPYPYYPDEQRTLAQLLDEFAKRH